MTMQKQISIWPKKQRFFHFQASSCNPKPLLLVSKSCYSYGICLVCCMKPSLGLCLVSSR